MKKMCRETFLGLNKTQQDKIDYIQGSNQYGLFTDLNKSSNNNNNNKKQ